MERDEYYFLFGRTDLDFGNLKKGRYKKISTKISK